MHRRGPRGAVHPREIGISLFGPGEIESLRPDGSVIRTVDRAEYTNAVCCLASPLRDHAGSVVGAISTSMPSSQVVPWHESRLAARLKAVALHISAPLFTSNASS